MANVSSSNGLEKRPKLRFPGFDEPWISQQFSCVFSFLQNNTLSRAELDSDGEVLNIHYGDVLIKFGSILDCNDKDIPHIASGHESQNYQYLQNGDIIIADTAEDETVGKATELVNVSGRKVEAGLHTIPCRPLSCFASMYLGYYMNTPHFHRQLIPLMQGIKVLSISKGNIAKTKICAPKSMLEQQKISYLLNVLDRRTAAQRKVIEVLKKYKRGLNHKLLSEIDGQNYQELGTVCSIVGGGTPDTLRPEYWKGNVEWFTPSEIGKSKYVLSSLRKISRLGISNSSAKLLPAGAVLLTTRATLGEMSIARSECSTNQGFQSLIADSKRVLPEYLYYLQILIKPWCEKYASGNTFREISKASLSKCVVPVPCLNSQKRIVCILSRIDDLIETHERANDSLTQIKEGLLQQLFI